MYQTYFIETPILNVNLCSWAHLKGKKDVNKAQTKLLIHNIKILPERPV